MAPGTAEVRICTISSILAKMGQVNSPLASTQILDIDGVVDYKNQGPSVEVMEV